MNGHLATTLRPRRRTSSRAPGASRLPIPMPSTVGSTSVWTNTIRSPLRSYSETPTTPSSSHGLVAVLGRVVDDPELVGDVGHRAHDARISGLVRAAPGCYRSQIVTNRRGQPTGEASDGELQRQRHEGRSVGPQDTARHVRVPDVARRRGRSAGDRLPGRRDAAAVRRPGDRRPPRDAQGARRLGAARRRRRAEAGAGGDASRPGAARPTTRSAAGTA